jgi:hypothetical protein
MASSENEVEQLAHVLQRPVTAEYEPIRYPDLLFSNDASVEQVRAIGKQFSSHIRSIEDDARKLGEFSIEEKSLIKNICESFLKTLSYLCLSIEFPKLPAPYLQDCKKVILGSDGNLIVVRDDSQIESKQLDSYPAEIVLMIIWAAVPELKEIVSNLTKRVSTRLELFNIIDEEIRNLQSSFESSSEQEDLLSRNSIRENARKALIKPGHKNTNHDSL